MSTEEASPTDPTPQPDPLDGPEPDDGQTFDATYVRQLRSEAATRRQEAREATERADTLASTVKGLREDAESRLLADAGANLQDPELVAQLVDLDRCRTEDGQLDSDLVSEAVVTLIEQRPYLRQGSRNPAPDPSQGARTGPPPPPSAGEALARVMGGGTR